jgi:hypothetical protein
MKRKSLLNCRILDVQIKNLSLEAGGSVRWCGCSIGVTGLLNLC